jgi:hypothetical protein
MFLAQIIELPPELQLIIQSYYFRLLRRKRFKVTKTKIQNELYFWLHIEPRYDIDSRTLPYVSFTDFESCQTPIGLKRLPRSAHILIPNILFII